MADFIEAVTASWRGSVQALARLTLPWRATLVAEASDFVRFNRGRVRQGGHVEQAECTLTLMVEGRSGSRRFPLTGVVETDVAQVEQAVADLQQVVPQLPPDPFLVEPSGNAQSQEVQAGQVPPVTQVMPLILEGVAGLDFTGLYAAGPQVRAYADSAGQSHWFYTETFTLDYSLFNEQQRAVKGYYSGRAWETSAFVRQLQALRRQLELLSRPAKVLPPGRYRTYLAPAAVAELVGMLSWGGLSEGSVAPGNQRPFAPAPGRTPIGSGFFPAGELSSDSRPPLHRAGRRRARAASPDPAGATGADIGQPAHRQGVWFNRQRC